MPLRSDVYFFASATKLSSYRRIDEGHQSGYLAKLLVTWMKSNDKWLDGYVIGAGKMAQTYVCWIRNVDWMRSGQWLDEFMDYLDDIDCSDLYKFIQIYEHPNYQNVRVIERGIYEEPELPKIGYFDEGVDVLIAEYIQHEITN